jgi:ABC-type nickel/cobalt efflux system permease component RcnA
MTRLALLPASSGRIALRNRPGFVMDCASFCRSLWGLGALLLVLLGPAAAVRAHPVPRRSHDRTIVVHLTADRVQIDYRLEVDEFTAVFDDLTALGEQVGLARLRNPQECYEAFQKGYAPILAANLTATLDGRSLTFTCLRRSYTQRDENGQPLGHLRCDFVFETRLGLSAGSPHRFTFREGNYELEEGQIHLCLAGDPSVQITARTEPAPALQARSLSELQPGDDDRLRTVDAQFTATSAAQRAPVAEAASPVQTATEADGEAHHLLALLLDTQQGMVVLLGLAALFGAAHALTPGHGKTLVAAYLVGERGTVGHALFLGLVTTITHTGAVLVLAAGLLFFFPRAVPRDVQTALGLTGGLLVAGMGIWLLLRRLSGGADHIHLGGHNHHHHGEAAPPVAASGSVAWWNLVVLGVSGGIVPCWDAILMLGFAISAQRLWLGLPLLLAFSAGLAGVLIALGIAVVYAKGFASSQWGESRLVRALPLVSAILVTGMGFWLCYDSVHSPPALPAVQSTSQDETTP